MYCPKDGNCLFDNFKNTGVHICAFSECVYPEALEAAIYARIAKILSYHQKERYAAELQLLKQTLNNLLTRKVP